jgi:hypothetical protein
MEVLTGVFMAVSPFAVLGGLLWVMNRVQARRAECIARQIALTDEIHRELGAAAAPVVERSWTRGWIVSIGVPLDREDLVAPLVGIAHRLFSALDRVNAPPLRVVLTSPDPMPAVGAARVVRPTTGQVARALAQVGGRLH